MLNQKGDKDVCKEDEANQQASQQDNQLSEKFYLLF
jgi:hypothetical protein